MQFEIITTATQLHDYIATLDDNPISLDTEFVRTRTYIANLGLLQVAQNQIITLIDPIAVGDLSEFWSALDGKECILHASSEDLELIRQHKGDLNLKLLDTQVACAFLNLGASLGYAKMVETLEAQGVTTQSRVIRKQTLLARGGVAARLKVTEGTQVIFLETLREVEGKPFCIISHFLPMHAFPQVLESYHQGSLHAFLEAHCNTKVQRSESLISAVLPEADDAELLNMPRNLPILRVKSLNVASDSQQPVEYVVTRFRGDATQLSVQP